MQAVLDRLNKEWEVAWSEVSNSSFWTPNNVVQARFGNLKVDADHIYALTFSKRTAVMQDKATYASWLEFARNVGSDIATQKTSGTSWGDLWQQVGVKSAEDLDEKLPDKDDLMIYYVMGVGVLILILAIKVT